MHKVLPFGLFLKKGLAFGEFGIACFPPEDLEEGRLNERFIIQVLSKARGDFAGCDSRRFAVHHRKCLLRDDALAASVTGEDIGVVEGLEKLRTSVARMEKVEASSPSFRGRRNRRSSLFQVEYAGEMKQAVSNNLRLHATTVHSPELAISGIIRESCWIGVSIRRAPLPGFGGNDESMQVLHVPA